MDTSSDLPVTIPTEVARYDDETFMRICNELGRQGVIDVPKRTVELELKITAGELIEVTHVKEDAE